MKVLFDGEEFPLVQGKVTFAEARAMESLTGHTVAELERNPSLAESVTVIQAMAYISIKRVRPGVTFSDLDDAVIDETVAVDDETEDATPDPTEAVVYATEAGAA